MPFKVLSDATGEELYALQQAGLLWWVSEEDGGSGPYIITIPCDRDCFTVLDFSGMQSSESMFGLLLEE